MPCITKSLWPLFNQEESLLPPARFLVDIGCGIKPQPLIACIQYLGVEPFAPYLEDYARRHQMTTQAMFWNATWGAWLDQWYGPRPDVVTVLDVVEHIRKEDGLDLLERTLEKAGCVVVFTPLGDMPQDLDEHGDDAWGFHGNHLQRHLSAWQPEDFPDTAEVYVDPTFHGSFGAILAVLRR
jgi:hypothetical protein